MNKQVEHKIIRRLKNRGFTLVETLIAVGILSLSVAAVFTAVQSGIASSTYAKDQIIAFYLAQDAMEFIRNVRDENALHVVGGASTHWLDRLASVPGDPCYFGKACTIDSPANVISECTGGQNACPPLKQDVPPPGGSGLFGYQPSWTDSRFTRTIIFEELRNYATSDEVSITVRISWVNHGITKNFIVTDSLFRR